jgi:long-chain acyl-CoA synthetase
MSNDPTPHCSPVTIPGAFERQLHQRGDQAALLSRDESGWRRITWLQCWQSARAIAAALVELGLQEGQHVGLAVRTRPEWLMLDLGIQLAGGVTVYVYPDNPLERQLFMLRDSAARILVCEDAERLCQLHARAAELPGTLRFIGLDPAGKPWPPTLDGGFVRRTLAQTPEFIPSWSQLLALGECLLVELSAELELQAALIYTSGTTRAPKGVRSSHDNLLQTARRISDARRPWHDPGAQVLLPLPLAHIMGRTTLLAACFDGLTTALEREPERAVQSCGELGASSLIGPPLLYEAVHARLSHAPPGALQRALGSKVRASPVGGAALHPGTLQWFEEQGIVLLECYGSTEAGYISGCSGEHRPSGSVGRATAGTRLRLAPDGELLVSGPSVMLGYHQRPEDDEVAFEQMGGERWFHTRDIARLDADGTLWLLGRKDELFKTSSAGFISPEYLQRCLRAATPLISRALVYGAGRPHVVALLTIDASALERWLAAQPEAAAGTPPYESPALRSELERAIAVCNERLSPHERIRGFSVLERELSHAENELTELGKPNRELLFEKHSARLAALYSGA